VLAGAAGELALAVLAAPGPPQLAILDHLEEHDKCAATPFTEGALA